MHDSVLAHHHRLEQRYLLILFGLVLVLLQILPTAAGGEKGHIVTIEVLFPNQPGFREHRPRTRGKALAPFLREIFRAAGRRGWVTMTGAAHLCVHLSM
jgi:hypothetical protein